MVSNKDKEILRALAGKVRNIAEIPEMEKRKELWRNFIDLKPQRPMVLCYPEGSWIEILPYEVCQCEDEKLRLWEWKLLSQIYWWDHIHDDNVLEPWFDIPWQIADSGFGIEVKFHHGDSRGSYVWEPPIQNLDRDFYKLRHRKFTVNRQATYKDLELANDIFGDILPARIRGGNPSCYGTTWRVVDLIGLENLMIYMYDDPENLHRLMAFIRDDFLNMMDWYETENLLLPQDGNDYVGSGGVAYTSQLPKTNWRKGTPLKLMDIWGCAESQETVGISPDMFREFILPYQKPLLAKTGLNHYGCCESLHERIDDLLKLPNMRRFSVSPWCDMQVMADKLGKNYIFSRKPNPSIICTSFDEKVIREDLQNTLKVAGDGVLEFIMKDTHTVQNNPDRITRWVEIAYEEISKYRGI